MTAAPTAAYPLEWEADVLLVDGGVAHHVGSSREMNHRRSPLGASCQLCGAGDIGNNGGIGGPIVVLDYPAEPAFCSAQASAQGASDKPISTGDQDHLTAPAKRVIR